MANAVSHDQNFKNLILDYPHDALAFFAADEAPAPDDPVRIVPARQEQLQERLGNRFRELNGDKRAKYIEFIDIYAGLTENEFRRYQRQYREDSSTMAGVISRAREEGMQRGMQQGMQQGMQRGMQQGMEQGMQRGMEQGMDQGRVEGERALLERQLRRRFGMLSPEFTERLSQASAADLETWADNVLDAPTLDDVFNSSR